MRVKTQNINLEGFDRIQEIVMRLKLAERTLPPGDITIKLNQDIIDGYCDYSWYGGLIAEVYSMDSEYRVMANGDVIVNLIDRNMGIDFNPTFFSHPKVKDGLTLSSPNIDTRKFWVEHGKACIRI